MIYRPRHFGLAEFVCPHVFEKFGLMAWQFFDDKILMTLDLIRDKLGKPITINTWKQGGEFDERGFRCIQCSLVLQAIKENRLYVSPHMIGKAADFDIEDMTAQEVRTWLINNQLFLPFPIRLEKNVNWVHLDVEDAGQGKVFQFDN